MINNSIIDVVGHAPSAYALAFKHALQHDPCHHRCHDQRPYGETDKDEAGGEDI